jgi:hypothetical protein
MEVLLSALSLIISTLQGITSTVLERAPTEAKRVGRELANVVISLDRILTRAEEIISYVEQLAIHGLSVNDFKNLSSQLKQQSKELQELAYSVRRLGLDSGTSPHWRTGTARVVHVFGEQPFELTSWLDYKGYMIEEMRAFIENEYTMLDGGRLVMREYRLQSKPLREPVEFREPVINRRAIEKNVRDGWLRYMEI